MVKKTIINRIYKDINNNNLTGSIYSDTDWTQVRKVFTSIQSTLAEIEKTKQEKYNFVFGTAQYVGSLQNNNLCKTYGFNIENEDGKVIIGGLLTATFCGTVNDPMSRYDITVQMW